MNSIERLQEKIKQGDKLQIVCNDSDDKQGFLNMSAYCGVVEYYPEELVITLKAGTKIKEIDAMLSENNQALPFYCQNREKSIGEVYATSGSEFSDNVLGVQIINGEGKLLNFGGQVIKNVAGYDVSKLLVGSKGNLALVTEVSLKILPQRAAKHYQAEPKPKNKVSALHLDFEKKLKQIFDPTGVFI